MSLVLKNSRKNLRCCPLIFLLFLLTPLVLWAQDISPITYAGRKYTVCRVDLDKHPLHLFWRDDSRHPFKSFSVLDQWLHVKGRRLTFAMNAGMYHGDFTPVGLYVEDGKELRPLNLSHGEGNFFLQPNGVFAITSAGAFIIPSDEYPTIQKSTILATQSGPLLVINGRTHPAFKPTSTSRLYRNGVGVVSPKQVVFAISEDPVSFFEISLLFRDHLHCKNALFLDGTISSLFSQELNRCDKKMDLGPMIGTTDPAQ